MILKLLSLLIVVVVSGQSLAKDMNSKENTTLIFVQALFRHGERAPLRTYHGNQNIEELWPEGLSNLTPQGKRQHYVIGKFLRSRYKDFLTFNLKEVIVNSSSYDRCLKGAEITAAALYEPEGISEFETYLNPQRIPVYFLNKDQDKHLSYNSRCPRGYRELSRLLKSEEMLEFHRNHQKMLEDVSKYIKKNISEDFTALFLHDFMKIERKYNITISSVLDDYFDEIGEFSAATFKSFHGSELMLRLRVGPLLKGLSENMQKKINGDDSDLKVQLICAHDIHIAAILTAINFKNVKQPPYLSSLLFELHQMPDSTMAIRLLYMNSTEPLIDIGKPHVLVLDDCSEFCPLENFTKKFQHLIPGNWEEECQLIATDDSQPAEISLVNLVIVATTSFLLFLYFLSYSNKKVEEKENKVSYKQHSNKTKTN